MKTKGKLIGMSTILIFGFILCSSFYKTQIDTNVPITLSKIESFSFLNKGEVIKGKIYLPASYNSNKNLPAIYLIDFSEQHFKLTTDEFERVIDGLNQIYGFDALVVSLENIPDLDAEPESYLAHFEIFKNMVSYVDKNYTKNTSRTFIGKGSESGIVLMTLFTENPESSLFQNFIVTDPSPKYMSAIISLIEDANFPKNKLNKKLHISFSTSNNRALCIKLISLIEGAKYPWLQVDSFEYKKSDFENTYPIAYSDGLKYIFQY